MKEPEPSSDATDAAVRDDPGRRMLSPPTGRVGLAALFHVTLLFCSQNTVRLIDDSRYGMVHVTNLTPPGSDVTTLAGRIKKHIQSMTAGMMVHVTNRVTPGSI